MASDELKDRIDLSALDPFADSGHGDDFVARVLDRSALELARRRRTAASGLVWNAGASVFGVMAAWARPALAAAALAVVVSGLALKLARHQQPAVAQSESGVLEAMSLPTPVQEWLSQERTPTRADMILTLEGGTGW